MDEEHKKWLKEKTTIILTRKEMFNLANMLADACRGDYEFTKSRNRKIRKIVADSIEERHKLWLKVVNNAESSK